MILALIDRFRELVSGENYRGFETNLQKVNKSAVEIYRKVGFQLTENPRNEASWIATAGPEILTQSPIIQIIEKRRSRTKQ